MKRNKVSILVLALFIPLTNLSAYGANPTPGASCSKIGKTTNFKDKRFTCIRSGTKLVWDKGVLLVARKSPAPTSIKRSTTPSASPSAKASLQPTASPKPSETQIIKSSIQVSPINEYRAIEDCKIGISAARQDVSQSHAPRSWQLIDIEKPIRILIFSVDFPDLISPTKTSPNFGELIKSMESFYESQSDGKIQFKWTIAPDFARMSKTIESYGVGSRATGSTWQLNNDIQDLAFRTYNREDFDLVIASAPVSTTREQIATSPAFGSSDPRYKGATYLGGDYWSSGKSWTIPAHEFGHFALGLADLYDFKSSMLGQSGFEAQFQHMGVYDIMNWAGGAGIELSAWNRWIGKLISDSQILCQPISKTVTLLQPIERVNKQIKGIVIPISQTSALIVENRAPLGYDSKLPQGAQGIVIYLVDISIPSGQGPMKVIRKPGSSDIWFRDNALKVGESLTYMGYTIKVLDKNNDDYYVEVQKTS